MVQEEFEDTKRVIRSHKSKDRKYKSKEKAQKEKQ
jgi:hypothetical protein